MPFWTRRLHPEDKKFLALVSEELAGLRRTVALSINHMEATVRQQIQDLIAKIDPLIAAVKSLQTEAAAERQTIADLSAKIAAGTELTGEEIQALADAGKKLSDLTTDVINTAASVPQAAAAAGQAANAGS